MSYSERLEHLNLPSLKYIRRRGDLIQLYRLVHKIDNLTPSKFLTFRLTCTRGDKYKIFVTRCATNIRLHSFVRRTVRDWNGLRFDTKDAKTLNGFKNGLDRELREFRFSYEV